MDGGSVAAFPGTGRDLRNLPSEAGVSRSVVGANEREKDLSDTPTTEIIGVLPDGETERHAIARWAPGLCDGRPGSGGGGRLGWHPRWRRGRRIAWRRW